MSESREERLRALLSKLDAEHEPTHEPARSVQLGRWQVADELRAILAMPETVGLPEGKCELCKRPKGACEPGTKWPDGDICAWLPDNPLPGSGLQPLEDEG